MSQQLPLAVLKSLWDMSEIRVTSQWVPCVVGSTPTLPNIYED